MTDQKPPATPPQTSGKPGGVSAPKPANPGQSPAKPVVPAKPPAPPPLPKPAFSVSGQAPKAPGAPSVQPPKPPAPPAPPKTALPAAAKPPAPPVQAPRPPQSTQTAPPPRPMSSLPSVPPAAPKTTLPPPAKPAGGSPEVRPPASSIQQAPRTAISPPNVPKTTIPGTAIAKPLPGGPILPTPPSTTPKTPVDGQIPAAPKAAEFKKSPLRFLPLIVGVLLLLGLGWFLYTRFFGARTTTTGTTPRTSGTVQVPNQSQTVLTYWGLWEPTPVLQQTLADFEAQFPGVKVNYQQQTYRDYRERLQTSIAGGKGPDVFRFHASWVPMLRAELDAMPTTVYTSEEFQNIFFPIANQQLKVGNNYVGVPLMYEGLALFYNKEVFQTANAQPPKTWAELKDLAKKLTVRNNGRIERAGIAVGNASNVDNFSDILGLLMLQNGADPMKPSTEKGVEALQFYTDFYTKDKVWDETLPNSTVAFSRGDVAMIIAPSWRAHDIIALNPNLTFDTAPVPQLGATKVTWASYWAEGVSAQSKNKDAAWELLKYMSSQNALQKLYSDASRERTFGEIYSRTDMSNLLADSPYVAAYLADAPFAQDSYTNSFTHDGGLNDQIIKYYEDAVNSISSGNSTPDKTVSTIDQGIRQILRQYNLTQ